MIRSNHKIIQYNHRAVGFVSITLQCFSCFYFFFAKASMQGSMLITQPSLITADLRPSCTRNPS